MKQKRRVSMIGMLFVLINTIFIITGCPQAHDGKSGKNDTSTKSILEFDFASVKCKKTNSYPYMDVTTGSQIQEKDELLFEAILPTGKIVENWYMMLNRNIRLIRKCFIL